MNNAFDESQHTLNLMQRLGFDIDDLDANRHGYMSKKQRKTLGRFRGIWKFFVVLPILIMPIAIIFAILDGYRIHDTPSSRFGVCVVIIIVAGGFSYHAYTNVQKFNKDLLKGDVLEFDGALWKYYFAGRGQEAIYIGNQVFRTNERSRFYAFNLGEKYRIFYAPFSKYVLSAKLLNEKEPMPEIPIILKANPPID